MNKPLTPRQTEIVNYLRSGVTNKQIGKALGVSPETVKTHIRNISYRIHAGGRLRYANDVNPYLIALWQHVQAGGELPDFVTEEMYRDIRLKKENYPAWLVAFVGFGCSFGGCFFAGYARGAEFATEARNSCYGKRGGLKNVKLPCMSYADFEPPSNSLIYCDIPYRNTTGHKFGDFKHEEFYLWAHRMTEQGHSVFVSEYEQSIPEGWQVVWGRESVKGLRDRSGMQQKTREVLIAPPGLWVNSLLF